MGKEKSILVKSIVNTLFFILGFSVIFISLGAGAGTISGFLLRHKKIISIIGGAIIILFSLQVMDIFKIPFLNYEKKAYVKQKPRGIFGALIIGITFAAAWTPCIGPILSSILILAATEETVIKGIYLLIAYSIGLGLPFLFSVIAFGSFLSFSKFIKRHFKTVEIVSGILLMGIGVVLILGQFERLSQMISFIPDLSLRISGNLSFFAAFFAGFVSFISPCVLPLIPSYLTFITGVSMLELKET